MFQQDLGREVAEISLYILYGPAKNIIKNDRGTKARTEHSSNSQKSSIVLIYHGKHGTGRIASPFG